MLIRLPISDFKFCLGIAFSATSTNKNRPVLNNVLLSFHRVANTDTLKHFARLTASDGDMTVFCDLRHITVQGEGIDQILLPPVLGSIIHELPPVTDVELLIDPHDGGRCVTVSSGMARFRLQTADPSEFPPSSISDQLSYDVSVDGALLQRAIQRVLPAIDPQATRYALGSILLAYNGGDDRLQLVATDGRRLALNELPANWLDATDDSDRQGVEHHVDTRWKNVLLSATGAKLLAKIAKDSPTVKLRADASTLTAEGLGVSIQCRLTEGRFPAWRKVIPKCTQVIELPTTAFMKSIKAAAATVDKENDTARLAFSNNSEGGTVTISIESEEGNATVDCPLPHPVEHFETTLRAQYLTQALAAMPADDIAEMHVPEEDGGAILLRNLAADFTAVIMPMTEGVPVEKKEVKK